jgi:hypothetical protein
VVQEPVFPVKRLAQARPDEASRRPPKGVGMLTRSIYPEIPLLGSPTSLCRSPPVFGPCNVSTCDLFHSHRGSRYYAGNILHFSDFVPFGILERWKSGTTGPVTVSDVPVFSKGMGATGHMDAGDLSELD